MNRLVNNILVYHNNNFQYVLKSLEMVKLYHYKLSMYLDVLKLNDISRYKYPQEFFYPYLTYMLKDLLALKSIP